MRERLYLNMPDPGDDRAGDRLRFADLGDFYPSQSPPAQTVNGTQPAAPQNAPSSAGGVTPSAPSFWMLALVAGSLALLHWE